MAFFSGAMFVSGKVYTLIVSFFLLMLVNFLFFTRQKSVFFRSKKKVELKKLEAENAARFGPGNPFLEGMTGPFGQ